MTGFPRTDKHTGKSRETWRRPPGPNDQAGITRDVKGHLPCCAVVKSPQLYGVFTRTHSPSLVIRTTSDSPDWRHSTTLLGSTQKCSSRNKLPQLGGHELEGFSWTVSAHRPTFLDSYENSASLEVPDQAACLTLPPFSHLISQGPIGSGVVSSFCRRHYCWRGLAGTVTG